MGFRRWLTYRRPRLPAAATTFPRMNSIASSAGGVAGVGNRVRCRRSNRRSTIGRDATQLGATVSRGGLFLAVRSHDVDRPKAAAQRTIPVTGTTRAIITHVCVLWCGRPSMRVRRCLDDE
uniref:Uncharacterized protein n=1 Tax=Plectus sambesii TaxID=2011161 RepID=A0A914W0Z5_9BILA